MYFDLFLPFPVPVSTETISKGKNKGKNKAAPAVPINVSTSCWSGIEPEEKEAFAKRVGLAGHREPFHRYRRSVSRVYSYGPVGFNVVAPTIIRDPEAHAYASPFVTLPFPHLDPRHPADTTRNTESGLAGPSRSQILVQVTRYHVRLDDARMNPIVRLPKRFWCLRSTADPYQTAANTNVLKQYDILSCQPTNDKALQLACTDLSNPGPNQVSSTANFSLRDLADVGAIDHHSSPP